MIYRKLKRTWTHNDLSFELQSKFKKVFPELKNISGEELCDRFIDLKLDFYTEEKTPVYLLRRLTMPFAIITMFIMFLFIPFNFLITGHWGYSLGKNNMILNWFKSLNLQ